MRDDNAAPRTSDSLPLPVRMQPDPMLEERPAGPGRMIATLAGAAAIIVLALYGMTRQPGQEQMAAPSETQAAPAGGGAANNAGGQAQPANAPAQNSQPGTTGQGAGEHAGQPDTNGQQQPKGQAGQSKAPPAAGASGTSAVGPGAKPAPEGR